MIPLPSSHFIYCWKPRTVPAAAAAKLLQSCRTLCNPTDGSPPGSPVPGILQARTLEWVAISFSNAWKWKVKVKSLSRAQPSATPWTAAYQAPPSMRFARQQYWSRVSLPSPSTWHILSIYLLQKLNTFGRYSMTGWLGWFRLLLFFIYHR